MKIVGWIGVTFSIIGFVSFITLLIADGNTYAAAGVFLGLGLFLSVMYALKTVVGDVSLDSSSCPPPPPDPR